MSQLVLWHGWGMHPSVWDGLVTQLHTRHGITSRVQALPGYNGTSLPSAIPDNATMDELTDILLSELFPDRQNVPDNKKTAPPAPVILCGWSLGAILALHAAQRHPDKIAGLILIGATPSFVQRHDWPHGMQTQALNAFTETVDTDPQTALKRFIALFNQNDLNARQLNRNLARIQANTTLPPTALLTAGLALLGSTDLRINAHSIRQATLLLHGAHDPLMPLAAAEWLAKALPHAQLHVFPDAAHAPFLSDTAGCAQLIANTLHA